MGLLNPSASVVVGVDPGKKGAVAVLHRLTGSLLAAAPLPEDPMELMDLLAGLRTDYARVLVGVEKPIVVLGRSSYKTVASSFRRFGHVEALLRTMRIPAVYYHPRNWTDEMHRGAEGSCSKEMSLHVAKNLWPGESFTFPGTKARKPNDNIIDAMLIAEYTRRHSK